VVRFLVYLYGCLCLVRAGRWEKKAGIGEGEELGVRVVAGAGAWCGGSPSSLGKSELIAQILGCPVV